MEKSSNFFISSKEIANKYIQNILFVDDEAFSSNEDSHSLNGLKITNIFANEKKLCTLNVPKTDKDLNNTLELAKKSDVIILDWKILLDFEETDDNDNEEDVTEDDVRGSFTLNLIAKLLEEQPNSLKLIMIYTGESALDLIVNKIHTRFVLNEIKPIENKDNELSNNNIKIIVRGKPFLAKQLNHVPHLKDWVIEYKDIPSLILDQFTEMTNGLISNVVLEAITSIRNNSSKLLSIYDKRMDVAFLSHRAMLPIMDDASELLKESIINSIKAIFDYEEISSKCSSEYISEWIENNIFSDSEINLSGTDITITNKIRKDWQTDGFHKTFEAILLNLKNNPSITFEEKEQINNKLDNFFNKKVYQFSLNYFLPKDIPNEYLEESFSILTHHKSNHASISYIPRLSLGSVIKGCLTNKYWVCIQQKCDSVRISPEEQRRFLFLPLEIVDKNKKFSFVAVDNSKYIYLKILSGTYDIRTIKFKSGENGVVLAKQKEDKKYYFCPIYADLSSNDPNYKPDIDEEFLWIMDLKDAHAQRISNKFAFQLCRVGLDESEWLRKKGS